MRNFYDLKDILEGYPAEFNKGKYQFHQDGVGNSKLTIMDSIGDGLELEFRFRANPYFDYDTVHPIILEKGGETYRDTTYDNCAITPETSLTHLYDSSYCNPELLNILLDL
ncbi:MAG: hypothetical protein K0R54_113 [Clostridiaceae bacterium]|jgi:hypothetical protein|nr:hypothetical protein [Clostridiaceae bacterium]